MSKWFWVALAFSVGFWSCWTCIRYKADQGFVSSADGNEWRMTRMQTLGLGDELVAVYERVK